MCTPRIYCLSLHDALPILSSSRSPLSVTLLGMLDEYSFLDSLMARARASAWDTGGGLAERAVRFQRVASSRVMSSGPCSLDRKSTRLNSSHMSISYAVLCL